MGELIRWIPDGAGVVADALAAGPDSLTVAQYQDAVAAQVASDSLIDGCADTIRGYSPDIYFYLGAREEYAETRELDIAFRYDRGAALQLPQAADRLVAPEDALVLHTKEFGDLSWYVANTLNHYDLSLPAGIAIPDFLTVKQLDQVAFGWAVGFGQIFQNPAGFFFASAEQFLEVSEDVLRLQNQANTIRLSRAAGQLMVSMSIVLQLRLDTKLAEVLPANLAKVERRIGINNIFEPGGDSR